MRIHTDTLTTADIYRAARFARADVVKLTEHGSRRRDHAFDVKLEGESRRRPNGGSSGVEHGSDYAATWDQWGVFLAVLFDIDPATSTTYDVDGDAFGRRTEWRFDPDGDNRSDENVFWPADAHGDHTFRFAGVPRQQSCTKCSATQSW